MTTTIEYALMAGASYISNRQDINQFPVARVGRNSLRIAPYEFVL